MKHAVLFATVLLAACGSDTAVGADGSTTNQMVTDVTTAPAADTTWSGTIRVHNSITIPAGVTVTVAAGSKVQIAGTAELTVAGTLAIAGTKASTVTIQGLASDAWVGLSIPSGGTVTMNYAEYTGGIIGVGTGGAMTVRDSQLSETIGDLLTSSGGNVDVQYSWIGRAAGQTDTTHCDLHFEGGGPTINVSHSNISTAVYALMFYTGTNADFTYNNWFDNQIQVDLTTAVTGDFSNGWFDKSPPTGAGITANNLATAMIADAGPR
jgi:hypothetical protein